MALYVDHARIPFRRMRMSHLMADSHHELLQAERDLGLPPNSIQHPRTPKEHLDVSETKRALAIRLGAQPVSSRRLVSIMRQRRAADIEFR